MKKLFFAIAVMLVTSNVFESGRAAAGEERPELVWARMICRVESHGQTDVTIDSRGLVNAGRFGLYRIKRDLAQKLMGGAFAAEELKSYPIRDFYLTPGSPGTIHVSISGYRFLTRQQKLRLDIHANRNSVLLENCELVR